MFYIIMGLLFACAIASMGGPLDGYVYPRVWYCCDEDFLEGQNCCFCGKAENE